MSILEGTLLRRLDDVRCRESRRERRAAGHRVAGEFYRDAGDPQRAYPAVHVTGTSGKGSVAWAVAHRLREEGYRVGLHVSPYLQVATEKIWIDGRYASAAELERLAQWVRPVAERYRTADCPATVHGMASAAIAFEAFRRAEVDVAVIEACCGGRWDITAHLDTRVAVITSVGDDHADVLGPTVADIARHKAGVLRRGAAAITGASGPPLDVVAAEAASLGVDLRIVPTRGRSVLASNRDLAEAVVAEYLARATPPSGRRRGAGKTAAFALPPGRFEIVARRPRVVLDVAHNPQKVRALVRSLDMPERDPVLVMGCIAGKSAAGIVGSLAPRFRRVVFTEPRAVGKNSVPAARLLERYGARFDQALAEPSAREAVAIGLRLAGPRGAMLVTGSAYLVGRVRGLWYPDDRVLAQRTSYPQ